MNQKTVDDPIVIALLEHLAEERDQNDPVGELSREILTGQAAAGDLLRSSWYGEGLATAAAAGQAQLSRMAPESLAKLSEAAARLGEIHDSTGRDDW